MDSLRGTVRGAVRPDPLHFRNVAKLPIWRLAPKGWLVKGSGRSSVLVLLLCVVAIAGLAALGWFSAGPLGAVAPVALLAVVPMLAAAFLSPLLTALIGVLALAAGSAVAFAAPVVHQLNDYVVALGGIAASLVVAVIVAVARPKGVAEPKTEKAARSDEAAFEDIEQFPVMDMRVQSSVDTDPMTGLLNRRGAIRALGHRNAEGDRVVAFLDCDLFRRVNDSYGTAIGDEFLQAIAGRLRHSLPAHDTVARWDGDEFLVAVAADATAAMPALQRVVGSINGHPIRTAAGPIETSMSVGAAVWLTGQDLEDVISRAGRALHAAKSDGRGQVVLDPGAGVIPVLDGGEGPSVA